MFIFKKILSVFLYLDYPRFIPAPVIKQNQGMYFVYNSFSRETVPTWGRGSARWGGGRSRVVNASLGDSNAVR